METRSSPSVRSPSQVRLVRTGLTRRRVGRGYVRSEMFRGRRWVVTIAVLVVAVAGGYAVFAATRNQGANVPPGCRVSLNNQTYTLSPDQAAHATTITAVGKRMGLPDHAVSVALAAALQESKLQNLPHGDRDSVGLFQQRPSQGWGSASQLLTPTYAAGAFYRHLARVPGWETLPVTTAAQRVQRSAAPSAYAGWEAEARAIAQATTGEIPAGMSCRVRRAADPGVGQADARRAHAGARTSDARRAVARGPRLDGVGVVDRPRAPVRGQRGWLRGPDLDGVLRPLARLRRPRRHDGSGHRGALVRSPAGCSGCGGTGCRVPRALERLQPRELLGAERGLHPVRALVADEVQVLRARSSTASSRPRTRGCTRCSGRSSAGSSHIDR